MTKLTLFYLIALFGTHIISTAIPQPRLKSRSLDDSVILEGPQQELRAGISLSRPRKSQDATESTDLCKGVPSEGLLPTSRRSHETSSSSSSSEDSRDRVLDYNSDEDGPMSKKRKTLQNFEAHLAKNELDTHQNNMDGVISAAEAFVESMKLAALQEEEEKLGKFIEQALDFMGYHIAWAFDNGSTPESVQELGHALMEQVMYSGIPTNQWSKVFKFMIDQLDDNKPEFAHLTHASLSIDNYPPHFRRSSVFYDVSAHHPAQDRRLELVGFTKDFDLIGVLGPLRQDPQVVSNYIWGNKHSGLLDFLARNGYKG
ncbi:hypothetical protein PtB15_11B356 [Puccinia triticina]|nr:hypothetical protein PtB15_11B356 [Puccinia triticina]